MTNPVFRTWFKSEKKARLMADALRKVFSKEIGEIYIDLIPYQPTEPDSISKAGYTFRVLSGVMLGCKGPEQFYSTALLIGEALRGYNQVSIQGEDFRRVKKDKMEDNFKSKDMVFYTTIDTLKEMGISLKVQKW